MICSAARMLHMLSKPRGNHSHLEVSSGPSSITSSAGHHRHKMEAHIAFASDSSASELLERNATLNFAAAPQRATSKRFTLCVHDRSLKLIASRVAHQCKGKAHLAFMCCSCRPLPLLNPGCKLGPEEELPPPYPGSQPGPLLPIPKSLSAGTTTVSVLVTLTTSRGVT